MSTLSVPTLSAAGLRWRGLLNDFQRSGLTQVEFCRRRGVSIHNFRKRLYSQKPSADGGQRNTTAARSEPTPSRFLPVTLGPAAPVSSDLDPLTLILAGGRRIAVKSGFDPDTLRRLIDVLESRP